MAIPARNDIHRMHPTDWPADGDWHRQLPPVGMNCFASKPFDGRRLDVDAPHDRY
ncbi:hypothetical protein [Rhodopirellula sp. MGV]|uniref:hypothetical protein n=1 Tax=Rhodopirellula sp. MGV TaxID=2023130 RepID=UPI0013045C5E|nr:hypothetical protein [Rhodopirellula sp. MGV]